MFIILSKWTFMQNRRWCWKKVHREVDRRIRWRSLFVTTKINSRKINEFINYQIQYEIFINIALLKYNNKIFRSERKLSVVLVHSFVESLFRKEIYPLLLRIRYILPIYWCVFAYLFTNINDKRKNLSPPSFLQGANKMCPYLLNNPQNTFENS